jgi:hypothetical protein
MRRLFPLLAILLLAGCGGASSSSTSSPATTTEPVTTSSNPAATADVFPAENSERATVVLYHGWTDIEPDDYLPWIEHLNSEGVAVIFPRYQRSVVSSPAEMLADAETATRDGLDNAPPVGPVIAVGYSLGGGYAVVYGANAAAWNVPAPAAIYAIFPAKPPVVPEPFGTVPPQTPVMMLVGDRDAVVGDSGATALAAAIAPHTATISALSSTSAIAFEHLSAKRTDSAAQRAFWLPLDRLIDRLTGP